MTEPWAQYARYNRLANQALYQACAVLSHEERRRDLGSIFRSGHGTLNHLLLGDRIWMTRFEGDSHPSTNLGAILFDELDALHRARIEMDARIEHFFGNLPADFLDRSIRYVTNAGVETEDPTTVVVPHFFNHQTHHRAQVHTLLSQLGRAPPALDLHRVIRPLPAPL
jgi:uncharacterized damage-inducible protein DinB